MADEGDLKQSSYEPETLQHGADNDKTWSVNRTETSSSAGGQRIEFDDRLIEMSSNDSAAKSTYVRNTVPTTENPFEKANRYLYKHNLFSLFQELVMNVAYKQPSDSISFMVNEIEKFRNQS
uniref:Uncharacterized protein n=1 Tax=Octopus bimaculoides TaxID=37653 RepID=A0A0L8FTQ9_OCTBM|eukprot:XP_014786995.1 PREDICTED: uncharacterized protein LOC106881205 [Octopus bimaculoides]